MHMFFYIAGLLTLSDTELARAVDAMRAQSAEIQVVEVPALPAANTARINQTNESRSSQCSGGLLYGAWSTLSPFYEKHSSRKKRAKESTFPPPAGGLCVEIL